MPNVTLPGTRTRSYPTWMPPWWRGRTLVLPYVVDANTTALARASESTSFAYMHWSRRPHTFFFAGNVLRNGGAAHVRLHPAHPVLGLQPEAARVIDDALAHECDCL